MWHRNGVPIPGATIAKYTLTAEDVGCEIDYYSPRMPLTGFRAVSRMGAYEDAC